LQQALPLLKGGGESVEMTMGVTALCRGEFEIAGSVEEARLWVDMAEEEERRRVEEEGGKRERSEKEAQVIMLGAAVGKRERRVWHARRACRLVVRDRGGW
jgi:hypothetical protein